MEWLRQFGGFFKKGVHVPAWRFNAGQKMIFWSVVLGGAALSVTGIFLLFPELNASFTGWQWMQTIHGIVSAIMIAIILAHIYIGSLGMEGAFDAMGSGEVDLNWAREHHKLWVEDELGRAEAQPRPGAADRPVAPAE
jgi:formate dehydrogenase subunit gamma